jgi:hypothetical protein
MLDLCERQLYGLGVEFQNSDTYRPWFTISIMPLSFVSIGNGKDRTSCNVAMNNDKAVWAMCLLIPIF